MDKFKLIPWRWFWKQVVKAKLDRLVEMREEIGEELELAIKHEVETGAYKKFVKLENQAHEILDWLAKNNGRY